ncbi:alpha/beta hydrolase [Xanthobacter autotrophicus]|uniref:alpha/beta hydrolase n=1 Tax=Xanthobacter autotrophicus TaxID=280 RepID=UPI0024A67ABD|nr:alpha/beta hydrolase [Xanthobacter autotrophicus]MDI4656633.1 alpha/beta hydrolase [Xanthobacter autotrophicus]
MHNSSGLQRSGNHRRVRLLAFGLAVGVGVLGAALDRAAAQAGKPRATAILVPGAGGAVPSDFLIRNRAALEQRGIATIVAQGNVGAAVASASRPVVVVGMSRGTLAAAAGSSRANGLVLVSGPLMPGPAPNSVKAVAGSPSALPATLIVHNPNDACASTPASGVAPFQAWSGKAQIAWVNSGPGQGNPCGPFAAHGFAGNDDAAVSAIASFILSR